MIQSNMYGKSSQSWIGFISWKKKLEFQKMTMIYNIYYILIESNVNTIESSKLRNYLTTKH